MDIALKVQANDAHLFDWYAAKRGLDLWQQRFTILNDLSL